MGTIEMRELSDVKALVAEAHGSDEPLIVFDGEDECLIAMRPAVFERILFDTGLINAQRRETLRL